jgi:metal-responsive CopG/Arc/MetJ family transcriptional regulator
MAGAISAEGSFPSMAEPMRPILVHMPEPLIKKLDRKAKRHGISRAELMRVTLEIYVDDIEAVTQIRVPQATRQRSWWAGLW